MNTRKLFTHALFFALLLALQVSAWAAAVPTVTQTITLNTGWNAVYLEVQPLVNDPGVVFKNLPAGSSIQAWTGKNNQVEFIQDPTEAKVNTPKWTAIYNPRDPLLDNFYAITANSAYLIYNPGAQQTITVEGRPTIRHKGWIPDSFNLVGFTVGSSSPSFDTFFTPSNSHKKQAIYRLNNASGAWEIVNNLSIPMRSGEAFWIYCQSGSDYQGPFTVEADGADGLDFGAGISILKLTVTNSSANDKTVSVTQLPAANAVALAYRTFDAASGQILTRPLSAMPPLTVKAGGSSVITLAAQRGSFSGSAASALEFTDGQGSVVRVPVTATSNAINGYPGLWSGSATLTKVSQLSESAATAPFSSGEARSTLPQAALNLNLILHQDKSGQVRLLKQVIVMQKNGTLNPDGTPATKTRYVALTDDKLIAKFSGVAQRDGAGVGRRMSAVGFDYSPGSNTDFDNTALKCTGAISSTVTCQMVLESSAAYTHPTNPFLHKYHPDHDNLDSTYKAFKPEVNRIVRDVEFVFDSVPKTNPENPPVGWGVTVLGGVYTEVVTGLAKGPIKTQGNFTISLATDVPSLNE